MLQGQAQGEEAEPGMAIRAGEIQGGLQLLLGIAPEGQAQVQPIGALAPPLPAGPLQQGLGGIGLILIQQGLGLVQQGAGGGLAVPGFPELQVVLGIQEEQERGIAGVLPQQFLENGGGLPAA